MSKRFTDSEKFSDIWYRKLPILQKVMYEYLIAECNHAGILEKFDIELMSFKIGADVQKSDFDVLGDRVQFLSDSVIYLTKFCKFQYGFLNPQNKVHNSVIKELNKWGLQAPTIPLNSTLQGTKDKDKDKDKDNIHTLIENKEEKEKEKEERNPDPYTQLRPELQKIWKQETGENLFISNSELLKAAEMSAEYPDFLTELPNCIKVLKSIQFPSGYKPTLRFLLEEKNYTDIRNGAYNKASPQDVSKIPLSQLQKSGMSDAEILENLRAKYG